MSKNASRATVTISGLEKTIVAAIQQTSIDCQDFIGVYIEHTTNHQSGANWYVKGIKYGRAPRAKCDTLLEEIVQNLQDRYLIESIRSTPPREQSVPKLNDNQGTLKPVSPLAAALKRISQR